MELQLELALSTLSNVSPVKGLLDPLPLFERSSGCYIGDDDHSRSRKRSFGDAFEDFRDVPRTLPLFLWDKQLNDNEDDNDPLNKLDDNDKGEAIVAWPPIKLRRKKFYHSQSKNNRTEGNGCIDCRRGSSSSKYVKVKMEGEAIGRKINLSLYCSLTTTKQALFRMFDIRHEKWSSYEIVFQDADGDWLIAEDVPWRSFLSSVRRLKLVKK
ncbi:hypothetical protein K2173_017841 [Erythroxylum novogranatense]|uniref:Auxin-responsive protein n=1 Tax=Erythroxylum novogranatense TaxID=1862640 RepID=A0AAV8SMG4_9ROSI|nr:hypothetical protein K2173_017841 [Erythroxylum novogranatense]